MPRLTEMMTTERIKEIADHMAYLKSRWADEHGHEDFAEYVESMRDKMERGATNITFTNRPWNLTFVMNGTKCFFCIKRNAVEYGTIKT